MTSEQFQVAFVAARARCPLNDYRLADALGVPPPTIDRWVTGASCPAEGARVVYLRKMRRLS